MELEISNIKPLKSKNKDDPSIPGFNIILYFEEGQYTVVSKGWRVMNGGYITPPSVIRRDKTALGINFLSEGILRLLHDKLRNTRGVNVFRDFDEATVDALYDKRHRRKILMLTAEDEDGE